MKEEGERHVVSNHHATRSNHIVMYPTPNSGTFASSHNHNLCISSPLLGTSSRNKNEDSEDLALTAARLTCMRMRIRIQRFFSVDALSNSVYSTNISNHIVYCPKCLARFLFFADYFLLHFLSKRPIGLAEVQSLSITGL